LVRLVWRLIIMSAIPNTISASQARSNFYTIIDEVSNKLRRFTITRRGQAKVVLMSPDEVEAWDETMEIMSDKKLTKDIQEGLEDIKKGRTISHEKLLKELGITEDDLK